MYNKVTLIGNLGKEPEVKQFDSGSKKLSFSLATSESYKDKSGEWQNKTEWHNIVVWGPRVDYLEGSLAKGHKVFVEGKITTNKWTDKDGNDRYTTEIVANIVKSLEKKVDQTNTYKSEGFQEPQVVPIGARFDQDSLPF